MCFISPGWRYESRYAVFKVRIQSFAGLSEQCGIRTRRGLRQACSVYIKFDYYQGYWQPPALPYRLQYSTIGRLGLNRRVRDGNGCFP